MIITITKTFLQNGEYEYSSDFPKTSVSGISEIECIRLVKRICLMKLLDELYSLPDEIKFCIKPEYIPPAYHPWNLDNIQYVGLVQ